MFVFLVVFWQDRQGIVKHMYKGTLFIYDENETENSGFFCVKSASCENMKESKVIIKCESSFSLLLSCRLTHSHIFTHF